MAKASQKALELRFEEIFKTNYQQLYFVALNVTHEEESAKDIVSDTFTYIWENSREEILKDHIQAYLTRTVHNRAIDYKRHLTVEQRYKDITIKTASYSNEKESDKEERLQKMEDVMDTLPPQTKKVFEEHYLNNHTYVETASILDISKTAVHKHIVKGFSIFRKKLLFSGDHN